MSGALWPSARCTIIGAATGEGTTVTASATVHAKGSWVTLGTASGDLRRLHLMIQPVATARYRLDLAFGTAGNEQIVVTDLFLDASLLANGPVATFELPLACVAGQTIRARISSTTANSTVRASIAGYQFDAMTLPVAGAMAALGGFTNTDPSATVALTGTTFTAWTEIVASTPFNIACLLITPGNNADTTRASARYFVEIGLGAAGVEQAIAGGFMGSSASGISMGPVGGTIWGRIAQGSRLAYRVRANVATTDGFAIAATGGRV